MSMRKFGAILVLMLLSVYTLSAASLSKVTVAGKQYYVYEVKKGDTMFGLARQFGWDKQTLNMCNPTQMSTLQKGTLIYYPCDIQPAEAHEVSETPTELKAVIHTVERGETLSSIARMYGTSVSELKLLNPGAGDMIQPGQELLVSKGRAAGDIANGFHTIVAGETLFGVAKANKVSIAAILEANPGISEHNFRSGEVIRIPAPGSGLTVEKKMVTENVMGGFKPYKVQKNDSWTSIAAANDISVETLMEANKGVELKKNHYIGIPVVVSQTVEREVVAEDPRDVQEIYADVHDIQDSMAYPTVRVAVVSVEPNTRRDREILRGILMSVNTLKNEGTRIYLKMIDGSNGRERNVSELESFNPDIVISTAESNMPAWLGQYAEGSKVPVVNTLDVRNEEYQANPYMVQLITPSEYFNDEIAAWFKDRYEGYSLVFTGEEDTGDQLAESLKNIWNPNLVRSRTVEDLKTKPLNNNGQYLLYSYPTGRQDVSEFLDAVMKATEKAQMAKVSVIGRPNWIVYDESLTSKFHKSNVQIPARFYMNKDARQNSEFSLTYRQLFGGEVPNTFPVYSGIGYDTALYFIRALAASGGDLNALGSSDGTVQSGYMLERPSSWTGPVNREVYVVRFTPYDTVEKIAVR